MKTKELTNEELIFVPQSYRFRFLFYSGVFMGFLIVYIVLLIVGSGKMAGIYQGLLTGCLSSILTTALIEYRDTKDKNNRMARLYSAAYSELWTHIMDYTHVWAHICRVLDKENKYGEKGELEWREWFDVVKVIYDKTETPNKKGLLEFIEDQLRKEVEVLHGHVEYLLTQENFLRSEYLMNDNIKRTLMDIKIDFEYRTWFDKPGDEEYFWEMAEAANMDMYNYINRLGIEWMNKERVKR